MFHVPVTQVRQADDYQWDITVKTFTKMLSSTPQKPSVQDTLVQSILQLPEQLIWAVDQSRAQTQTIQNWLNAETASIWSDLLSQITSLHTQSGLWGSWGVKSSCLPGQAPSLTQTHGKAGF